MTPPSSNTRIRPAAYSVIGLAALIRPGAATPDTVQFPDGPVNAMGTVARADTWERRDARRTSNNWLLDALTSSDRAGLLAVALQVSPAWKFQTEPTGASEATGGRGGGAGGGGGSGAAMTGFGGA